MAYPPADPEQHRRTQRRRAWIGWGGGLLAIALIVAAAIAGGDSHRDGTSGEGGGLFDYHLSSRQFAQLKLGESESTVVDRLGKVGLPENLTNTAIVEVFPLHEEDVNCSYWELSDAVATVVRLCFSSADGALVDKRERDLAGAVEGGGSTV